MLYSPLQEAVSARASGTPSKIHRQELISQGGSGSARRSRSPKGCPARCTWHRNPPAKPPAEGVGNERRTVVAADVPWYATHREEFRERVHHVLAGDATIDLQGEASTGVLIDDRQPLQLAAAHRAGVEFSCEQKTADGIDLRYGGRRKTVLKPDVHAGGRVNPASQAFFGPSPAQITRSRRAGSPICRSSCGAETEPVVPAVSATLPSSIFPEKENLCLAGRASVLG